MNDQTRTIKSIKNITTGLISKAVIVFLTFIDRSIFIKILGASLLGVNGLFTNILLVLSLAELGMTNVMILSYYAPLANKDEKKLSALTNYYKKIYLSLATVVTIIGIALIPFLKYLVNLDTPVENLTIIYLLFLANTVVSYLFIYKSTILTADQNAFIASKFQIIFDILRTVVQIIVLVTTKNFVLYLGVKSIASFSYNFVLCKYTEKKYPFINQRHSLPNEDKRKIFKMVQSGFIYKLAGILLNGTDNILISMIVGTIWVGYISNYDSIISSIMAFVVIVFSSLTASIGNLSVTETAEKRKEIFNIMLYISFWLAKCIIPCMLLLSTDLITIWIGKEYLLPNNVFFIKISMMYLSCVLNPIFIFRDATGLYQKSKFAILAAAIINIILSIILGNIWGLSGILFASIVSMLLTYLWYEPILLYKEHFSSSSNEYFIKHFKNIFYLFINIFICYILVRNFSVSSWSSLIIKTGICFITTNIINLLFSYKDEQFVYLKSRVVTMFK